MASAQRNVKTMCNNEAVYLISILNNKTYDNLIKETKEQLHKILIGMRNELKIELNTALSDGVLTGNIGKDKPDEKIVYLLSQDATIREIVVAISNIIYDVENAKKLYKYIMKNKEVDEIKDLYKKIQMITKNKHPEMLNVDIPDNKNIALLWCPLLYSYPGYIFKKSNIYLHSLLGKTTSLFDKEHHLVEAFSIYEIEFLSNKGLNLSNNILPIQTGMNLYGDLVNNLNYYNYEDNSCHVAGISGHSLLHFTLGKMFNIDYRYILIGQLYAMIPMHHSMMEVCWAANDIGYLNLFENYIEMRETINDIISKLKNKVNTMSKYQISNSGSGSTKIEKKSIKNKYCLNCDFIKRT